MCSDGAWKTSCRETVLNCRFGKEQSYPDNYDHDRDLNTNELISLLTGTASKSGSYESTISPDGRCVLVTSLSQSLIP